MMDKEAKELIRQHAWGCQTDANLRWAIHFAELGMFESAAVVADVAFHQVRIKAIQRESEQFVNPLPVL